MIEGFRSEILARWRELAAQIEGAATGQRPPWVLAECRMGQCRERRTRKCIFEEVNLRFCTILLIHPLPPVLILHHGLYRYSISLLHILPLPSWTA